MADIIISAHGGRFSNQQRNLQIPNGSSVAYYVDDRQVLSNRAGYYYLGRLRAGTVDEGAIRSLLLKGRMTYDYGCWYAPEFAAACGIFEVGTGTKLASLDGYDEDNPLSLSQIFADYPGARVYWLCCREVEQALNGAKRSVSAGSYLTAAEPEMPFQAPNLIPGATVLGMGFNAIDTYSTASLTEQIFDIQPAGGTEWTYQPTGITYEVPQNVIVTADTVSSGSAHVFQTEELFQSYFAAKASISSSYGAFSAEFSASYSQQSESAETAYYGLYEAEFKGWDVGLQSQSSSALSPNFTEDPDVKALPETFNASNQELFFTVFRKFGTHYVVQASAGGSLDYALAILTSFSSNQTSLQVNVSLEYDALFVSASAESQQEWAQLGQRWASSRTVQINAVGGDSSVLNALSPQYGDSFSGAFSSWEQGVMKNPSVISFGLRPLNLVFSGATAQAVSKALQVYMNAAIVATANADYTPGTGPGGCNFTTSSNIMVNGVLIAPEPPEPAPAPYVGYYITPVGGYQLAVLDPVDLSPILSAVYYQGDPRQPDTFHQLFDDIMADVADITQTDYIVVIAGFAVNLESYPTPQFCNWIASCGASMEGWKQYIGFTGSPGLACYVFIGRTGLLPGGAIERFGANTDWADYPTADNTDVNGIAMIYADTAITALGNVARGSLRTQRQLAEHHKAKS